MGKEIKDRWLTLCQKASPLFSYRSGSAARATISATQYCEGKWIIPVWQSLLSLKTLHSYVWLLLFKLSTLWFLFPFILLARSYLGKRANVWTMQGECGMQLGHVSRRLERGHCGKTQEHDSNLK